MKVPGSISSALAITYLGWGASAPIGIKLHLSPVGKPGAAAAAQARCLNFFLTFCGAIVQGLAEALIAARTLILLQARALGHPARYCLVSGLSVAMVTCTSCRIPSIFAGIKIHVKFVIDHHRWRVIDMLQDKRWATE